MKQFPVLGFEHDGVGEVPCLRRQSDDVTVLLKPALFPSVVTGQIFKGISNKLCKDAIKNFKESFEKQMIDKGKMGRCSDDMPAAAADVLVANAKSLPRPFCGECIFSAQEGFTKALNEHLLPQLWGSTSSWEVSAAEPGFIGSLRINIEGTRSMALTRCMDADKYLRSKQSSSSALQKGVTVSELNKWFRNMGKDCVLQIKLCM